MIEGGAGDGMMRGGREEWLRKMWFGGLCGKKGVWTNRDGERGRGGFEKKGEGFVMGEGGGIVVVEEVEDGLKGGGRIYGEIVGYG